MKKVKETVGGVFAIVFLVCIAALVLGGAMIAAGAPINPTWLLPVVGLWLVSMFLGDFSTADDCVF